MWHESQVRPVLWCRMLLIFGGMETYFNRCLACLNRSMQAGGSLDSRANSTPCFLGWMRARAVLYMLLQVQSSLSYILVSEQITAGSTAAAILLPYYMGLGRQGLTQNAVGGKTPGILLL